MGVMDKFLNYMKLNDEEDEGFYDDDYLDDENQYPNDMSVSGYDIQEDDTLD